MSVNKLAFLGIFYLKSYCFTTVPTWVGLEIFCTFLLPNIQRKTVKRITTTIIKIVVIFDFLFSINLLY